MGTLTSVLSIRGRKAETQVLRTALDQVASGRPSVVLIEGEPGIGKTRLLDEAIQQASGQGMQVAAGRAEELEQARPFGLVAAAFGCASVSPDPRRAAIAALLAGATGERGPVTVTSDPGLRYRVVDAFADLAEELALAGPLVIGADDLQWADPSSLLTLSTLSRRLAYLPVALIGCLRPAPRVADLDRLVTMLEAAGAHRLTLRGLADVAVTELVTEAVAAAPGPGLLSGIAGAAGNPLFVTELLSALAQEGAISTADGQAEVTAMTLPPTLRLTILRRLSFLPEGTLQALRAASILGTSCTVSELSATMARPVLGLSLDLAAGITGQVLADDGDRLRFRHDLIREAIYADIPGSFRRALHREAGQRLAAAGAPILRVAEQFARGSAAGDAEAISWLLRAARAAAATSPESAAGLLERAIALMDLADPARDAVLAERASWLMSAGQVVPAEQVCRELLGREHDPAAAAPARICLGHVLLAAGRPHEGLGELERALESPVISGADRSSALGWASIARMWLADLDGSAATAQQARSAAAAAQDHMTGSIAAAMTAIVALLRGQLSQALETINDAVRAADQSPARHGHRYPLHTARAFVLIELDQLEAARATIDAGTRLSEELGIGWHLPSYRAPRTLQLYLAGDWDDAVAEIEASTETAAETGETFGLTLARCILALICFHRNDLSRAQQALSAATEADLEAGARYRAPWALWARALILDGTGKTEDAARTLNRCWDRCSQLGLKLEYPILGPDLVRLALARGDQERAREVAAAVAEIAASNQGIPWLAGAALRCRGLAEHDADILAAAAQTLAGASRPLELALAAEEAGTAFARQGRTDQARPLLQQAAGSYERLDAARDLARTEAVLRGAGIRRGRRRARGRPRIGWPSLTPTERTIADFVAEGLSNPQIGDRLFVSRRTVQTHVAHIFTKLDITSRAQLAAEVTERRRPRDQQLTMATSGS